MAKWTGPGRFTTSVNSSQAAALQAQARKIVGELQNQVKLGKIWQGFRRIQLADGVEIVAHVDSTYPDNPLVRASVVASKSEILSEDKRRKKRGIVWQFAADDLFFTSRRQNDQITFSVFSNNANVETFVDTILEIPSYRPKIFKDKILAGQVDWQAEGKNIVSWAGPKSRSIIPIFSGLSLFGPDIYRNGVKVFSFTNGEKVLGAAEINRGFLAAVVVNGSGDFVAYRIKLSDGTLQTMGFFSKLINGETFTPRSPAFFNASASKASIVIDNLDSVIYVDSRNEVWAELTFSAAGGFSVEEFKRPMVYEYKSLLTIQRVTESITGLSSSSSNITESTINTSASFTDVSGNYGFSWATPSADRLVCVDYKNNTPKKVVLRRMPPRVERFSASRSLISTEGSTYNSFFIDIQNGIPAYARGPLLSGNLNETINISVSARVIPDEMILVLSDLKEIVISGHVFDGSYSKASETYDVFSASYPDPEDGGPTISGSFSSFFIYNGNKRDVFFDDRIIFYLDARFEVAGLLEKANGFSKDINESLTKVADPYGGEYKSATNTFVDEDAVTQTHSTNINNVDTPIRKIVFRGINDFFEASRPPWGSEFFETATFNKSVTVDPVGMIFYIFPGATAYTSIDEIEDLGFDTVVSDSVVNAVTRDGGSSFIGSGASTLFRTPAIYDHSTAQNDDLYVDLLRVDGFGDVGMPEYTRFVISGFPLQEVVFPKTNFAYIVKNV